MDLAPPATGARLAWEELPASVRGAVEARIGSPVVHARTQVGGFSPGLAARVVTEDGRRLFLKAVTAEVNERSVELHRREAAIAAALPAEVPAPRFHWSLDDGHWVVLAFEDVDGRLPHVPWTTDDLGRVLDALTHLAGVLRPSPVDVPTVGELHGAQLTGWRNLAATPSDADRLPRAWRDRLDELVRLEEAWPAAAAGDGLVHFDLRADNLLLTAERVYVVDWPWAARGDGWVDLVLMLPSVAMQGGPRPEDVWRAHPLAASVDDGRVDAVLAACAGMLTRQSLQRPPPGLPTLRAFQAAQAVEARAWLAERLGWRWASAAGG